MSRSMLLIPVLAVFQVPLYAKAEDVAPPPAPVELAAEGLQQLSAKPKLVQELAGDADDLDDAKPMSAKDAALVGATTVAVGAPLWRGLVALHEKAPRLAKAVDVVAPVALPIVTTLASTKATELLGVKERQRRSAVASTAAQVAWSSRVVKQANADGSWARPEVKEALLRTPQLGAAAEVAVTHLPHDAQERLENAGSAHEPTSPAAAEGAAHGAGRFVLGAMAPILR